MREHIEVYKSYGEVAKMLRKRKIDFCCRQETKWKGEHSRTEGGYTFFWKGCKEGTAGVGMMVAEKWVKNVVKVKRVKERMMVVRMRVGHHSILNISVYATSGEKDEGKRRVLHCAWESAARYGGKRDDDSGW